MKLATAVLGEQNIIVQIIPDTRQAQILRNDAGEVFRDMIRLIESNSLIDYKSENSSDLVDLSTIKILAPIPRPSRNIFCVGKNYRDHAEEFTRSGYDTSAIDITESIPKAPIIFSKLPETVIASGDEIRYPVGVSDALDYEAELAVVIGKTGSKISREAANEYIFGYTIINDVTARDLQSRHKQWLIGKSLDTFCPMGPWLVTKDEVDVTDLDITCWVNGELRQSGNTKDLIYNVGELIETISSGITLLPGDILATGTPSGVGVGFKPPKYLGLGDSIKIEISGLGCLVNKVG